MATARFYYYPDPDGSLESLSLGGPVSSCEELRGHERVMVRDGNGSHRTASWGGKPRVRITRERGIATATVRALESMWEHLLRGGAVGFSADHTKTWAAYQTFSRQRGDTTIFTGGNQFAAWSASAALSNGDEVWYESQNPEHISEMLAVTSVSATYDITMATAVRFSSSLSGMVRWRYFYPALRLPDDRKDRPILTSYHGLTWSLDAELEVDMAILAAGYDDYGDTATRVTGNRSDPVPVPLALADDAGPNRGEAMTLDGILGDSRKRWAGYSRWNQIR